MDKEYIQGMEDYHNIIKAIFELSQDERIIRFGYPKVEYIMDKFDFQQIREKMVERLEKKYIIRGIKEDDFGQKKIAVESDLLSFKPDETLINAFLNCHKDRNLSFATVEEIYVRADK